MVVGGGASPQKKAEGAPKLEPIRVAFLHPDLGIGGAERLVVDAGNVHAEGRKNRGEKREAG